jgi:hypothetical protein
LFRANKVCRSCLNGDDADNADDNNLVTLYSTNHGRYLYDMNNINAVAGRTDAMVNNIHNVQLTNEEYDTLIEFWPELVKRR